MKQIFTLLLLIAVGCEKETITICTTKEPSMSVTLSKSNPFGFNITVNGVVTETINAIECGINEGYAGEVLYSGDSATFYFESTTGKDVTFKIFDCDTGTLYVNKTLTITQTDGLIDKFYVNEILPEVAYGKKVKIQILSTNDDLINGNVVPSIVDELDNVNYSIVATAFYNEYEYVLATYPAFTSSRIYRRPYPEIGVSEFTILKEYNSAVFTQMIVRNGVFILTSTGGVDTQGTQSIFYSNDLFLTINEATGTSDYSYNDATFLTNSLVFARSNAGDDDAYSEDAGVTWITATGSGGDISRATRYSNTKVFLTGASSTALSTSTILESTYPFLSSTTRLTALNTSLYDIKFLDANVGYAVGVNTSTSFGVIYKTIDSGLTWTLNYTDEGEFYNVFFKDNFVIATGSSTYTSDDAGVTWFENLNVVTAVKATLYDQYILTQFSTQYTTKLYNVAAGESFLATSEIIEVRESTECTKVISYYNDTDFDGIEYETVGITAMQLRVDAQFWKQAWIEEQESFEKSNGSFVRAFNQKLFKKRLELSFLPNYMHDTINRILMHDHITIEGTEYIKLDEYEHENLNRYNLAKASVWLTEKNNILKNVI